MSVCFLLDVWGRAFRTSHKVEFCNLSHANWNKLSFSFACRIRSSSSKLICRFRCEQSLRPWYGSSWFVCRSLYISAWTLYSFRISLWSSCSKIVFLRWICDKREWNFEILAWSTCILFWINSKLLRVRFSGEPPRSMIRFISRFNRVNISLFCRKLHTACFSAWSA